MSNKCKQKRGNYANFSVKYVRNVTIMIKLKELLLIGKDWSLMYFGKRLQIICTRRNIWIIFKNS